MNLIENIFSFDKLENLLTNNEHSSHNNIETYTNLNGCIYQN